MTRGHGSCYSGAMRAQRCFYGVALALGLSAACGGISGKADSVGMEPGRVSGVAGTASGGLAAGETTRGNPITIPYTIGPPMVMPVPDGIPPTTGRRVPAKHRAAALACDNDRRAGYARPYDIETLPACSDAGACEAPLDCNGCRAACIDYGTGPRCVVG